MLDLVTNEDLRNLTAPRSGFRVSISMPTHLVGADRAQDPIRLRNLLVQAEQELAELGVSSTGRESLLAPAQALLSDETFWPGLEHGLVVLAEAEATRTFRLAEPVTEQCVVAEQFAVRPLLPALAYDRRFWVLAISRNDVRLLSGNRVQLDEVDLGDTPRSVDEALRSDDREPQLQSHGAGRVAGGRVTAAFHGQGASSDTAHEETERFCRRVDHHIRQLIGPSTAPTILAGERRLLDTYRSVSRLENLVPDVVSGSPDRRTPRDLADAAWPLIDSMDGGEGDRVNERIDNGTVPVMGSLDQVLVAAVDGRVEALTIPDDRIRWGRFDQVERLVVDSDQRRAGDVDLFDLAANLTIAHGGQARVVPSAEVPGGGAVAAVLRY